MALRTWLNEVERIPGGSLQSVFRDPDARRLQIAEVNACGALHKILAVLPGVKCSEYKPDHPGIPHQDLLNLSYPKEAFDVVLHSDTLEHVPDIRRAMSEIYRVLRPGGVTIFTVPLVRDGRKTVVRAGLESGGGIKHFLPPSFHGGSCQTTCQYLVYYEFGDDFFGLLEANGFATMILEHNENPAAFVITGTKPG